MVLIFLRSSGSSKFLPNGRCGYTFGITQFHFCWNLFSGQVTLDIFEEFVNCPDVQEEAPAKKTSERITVTESASYNSTCTIDTAGVNNRAQQHRKLCKVSKCVNDDTLLINGHNSGTSTLTWKGGAKPQKFEKDVCTLTSAMEKLVESANFRNLGIIFCKIQL